MSTSSKGAASNSFKSFYWGVIRVVHKNCSFIELARRLNMLVHPKVIEVPESENKAIPCYMLLGDYFIPDNLYSSFSKQPLRELEIYNISSDFDRQKTLLIGGSFDEILNNIVRNPKFMGKGIHIYAKPDFEYVPVQTMDRVELNVLETIFKKLAQELGGNAVLDTVGKVASFDELLFWRKSIVPEPTAVPGLTRDLTRILESAIAYGYYERPRRITLEALAKKMSMTKSTLNQRLREIEEKIVNNALYTQLAQQP